jgi:DNA-binding transcriptional LysR family regulator
MSRFEELTTFVAIARAGSISRAAEQRRMAKSAVSRRLSDLEARLGVPLVTRTTRRLSLTDAGERFLRRTERILDELTEAESEARADQAALTGTLRIAAPLSFAMAKLRPLVSDFITAHPELSVELDLSDRRVDLVEEGFDLALRIGRLADSTLIARRVAPIAHQVAASPEFWKIHGRPQSPQEMEPLPCLAYGNAARPGVLRFRGPDGAEGAIEPPLRLSVSNGEFVTALAVEGHGFVMEPDFILEPYLADGRLEIVLEAYTWPEMNLFLVYPPNRRMSARARAFSDAVVERFG